MCFSSSIRKKIAVTLFLISFSLPNSLAFAEETSPATESSQNEHRVDEDRGFASGEVIIVIGALIIAIGLAYGIGRRKGD